VFHFKQPVPTSAYLIALAGGNLERREISTRCAVWAEPEVVEEAAFEFSDTESFLSIAESLAGPYQWTRYDVLCLPPSFPYGGMENPCLTFATPTLLAGDKSLADVIAHEIAHSWTGNLVTNATWEHFWLNEGWTVWLERKITSRFKGSKEHGMLSAEMGWKHLKDDVALLECNCKPGFDYTKLVWPLGDQDPDEAFSGVPYEKGFCTLNYLENMVGSPAFEAFAMAYIDNFKFRTVTTLEFSNFFEAHFKEVKGPDFWENLFFGSGMFFMTPDFSNGLSDASRKLAARWVANAVAGSVTDDCSGISLTGWSSQQTCVFLEAMLDHVDDKANPPFPEDVLKAIDAAYNFTASKNAEIRFRWQRLCLASDVAWIVPHVFDFVKSQGRMKFVRPLYRSLAASSAADEARKIFMANATAYHPIARKMLANDLKVTFV
jgi:leukotriene-A4 hydrolase